MPYDIATQIVVLSSQRVSGHITGQVLMIEGGMEGAYLNIGIQGQGINRLCCKVDCSTSRKTFEGSRAIRSQTLLYKPRKVISFKEFIATCNITGGTRPSESPSKVVASIQKPYTRFSISLSSYMDPSRNQSK